MPILPTSEKGEAIIVSAPVAKRYAPEVPVSRISATTGNEEFLNPFAIISEATGTPPLESIRARTPRTLGSVSAHLSVASVSSGFAVGARSLSYVVPSLSAPAYGIMSPVIGITAVLQEPSLIIVLALYPLHSSCHAQNI